MAILQAGDTVAFVACSNALTKEESQEVVALQQLFASWGVYTLISPTLLTNTPTNFNERARILNDYYADETVKVIFDLSGGDLANGLLPALDYHELAHQKKLFVGYSDLTSLLNPLYELTNNEVALFQLKMVVRDPSGMLQKQFYAYFFEDDPALATFSYQLVAGDLVHGKVVGGNVRCLLKLAGTTYFPSLAKKVLFLEANSGDSAKISSYFQQIVQLREFDQLSGVILGNFTEYNAGHPQQSVEELFLMIANKPALPVARTTEIGHQVNSKLLPIGKNVLLK
jgi:muramoyltetrapeptide carboxypeptidase LdcA involved in peptidoglycan recycling